MYVCMSVYLFRCISLSLSLSLSLSWSYVQNGDGAATHPNTPPPPSFSSSPCYIVNVLSIKGKPHPRPWSLVRVCASHVTGEEGTNGVVALAVDFALVLARDVGEE